MNKFKLAIFIALVAMGLAFPEHNHSYTFGQDATEVDGNSPRSSFSAIHDFFKNIFHCSKSSTAATTSTTLPSSTTTTSTSTTTTSTSTTTGTTPPPCTLADPITEFNLDSDNCVSLRNCVCSKGLSTPSFPTEDVVSCFKACGSDSTCVAFSFSDGECYKGTSYPATLVSRSDSVTCTCISKNSM